MIKWSTFEFPATQPRFEKTMNSRSPDIEDMNENIRQTHNIYHIQNSGTVCMSVDSFNAHGVRMKNCGNNIPKVTCSYSFLSFFPLSSNLAILYCLDHHPSIIASGNENVIRSHHAVSNGMWVLCAICH